MINLQPYASPMYFVWLLLAFIPAMIALSRGVRLQRYETVVGLAFIVLMFTGDKWHQGVALLTYLLWQWVVVMAYRQYRQRRNATPVFVVAVLLTILPLVLVKLAPLWSLPTSLLGFLGISYLTFKAVQMVMGLRDGTIKTFTSWEFFRFLCFFPTISSGPIDRFQRFNDDVQNVPAPNVYGDMVARGVHNIFVGFLYKFILGYAFGELALPQVARLALRAHGMSWALVAYMYVYSLYLFFDFAGYSLFAVGTSNLLGIETPVNFDRPFLAPNIKTFWNRWHMSLSFWFRDFVFMRVTFFIMKHKLVKNRVRVSQVAYLINFLVMGFWHGVTWYYIVYGLFHAGAIIVNDSWLRYKKKHRKQLPHNRWTHALAVGITFHVVCFSFLIFSGFLDQLWR